MRRYRIAVFLTSAFASCATMPEPRPAAMDPSNPAAPESPGLPPLEAFAGKPHGLDEPLTPYPSGEETPPPGRSEHDHPDGHARQASDSDPSERKARQPNLLEPKQAPAAPHGEDE